MESRLEKVEEKLTFAEDMLEELGKTLYLQQCRIDQMERDLKILREQVRTSMPAEPYSLREEIPPHY